MKYIDNSKSNFSMIQFGYAPDLFEIFKSQLSVPMFITSTIETKDDGQEDIPLIIVRNDKDKFFLVENKRQNQSAVLAEHIFSMIHHINYRDLSYNVCPVWYTEETDLNEIPNHFVDVVMNKMPVIWLKDYPGKEKEDFFAQSVAFFYVKNVFKKDKQPDAFIIHLISTSDVPLIKSKLPRDIRADGPLKIYPCDTNSFQGHK